MITCQQCGKAFEVPFPSRAKKRKYCSIQCCGEAHTGENHPNWGGGKLTRTCEMCGKEFLVKPHIVKGGGGNFCSHRCYSRAKRQPLTIMCRGCGYMFDIMPFELGKRKYCSLECYQSYQSSRRVRRV